MMLGGGKRISLSSLVVVRRMMLMIVVASSSYVTTSSSRIVVTPGSEEDMASTSSHVAFERPPRDDALPSPDDHRSRLGGVDGRALQGGGGGGGGGKDDGEEVVGGGGGGGGGGPDDNNNSDTDEAGGGLDNDNDDATPTSQSPSAPNDPCLICYEDMPLIDDIVIFPDNNTTCADLASTASLIELDSDQCDAIRLAEETCCLQPTTMPTQSPTTDSPTVTPTVNPTEYPTTSPTDVPSTFPSISPTTSLAPSSAPIPYVRSDRVDARYAPWDELSEAHRTSATDLHYNQSTWEHAGTNDIEGMHHGGLNNDEKAAALELGYVDPESWDCWQNHYENYKWIDLGVEYVQALQWWEALGWDIYSWNRYEDPPPSDTKGWYELTDDERYAAAQLCYTRRTWDSFESLAEEYPMDMPDFRFTEWYGVDDVVRDAADVGLKYSPLTWNVLGLNVIEMRAWDDLTQYEMEAATTVGFTRITWDCWQ